MAGKKTHFGSRSHTLAKVKPRVAKSRDLRFALSQRESPQRLGVGGLIQSPPLRKRGVGGFDIKRVKQISLKNNLSLYQPAPTTVGGAIRKPRPKDEICKSRKERKEVLFAIRRTGKGGAKNKRPTWTQESYVRC